MGAGERKWGKEGHAENAMHNSVVYGTMSAERRFWLQFSELLATKKAVASTPVFLHSFSPADCSFFLFLFCPK